MRFENSFDVDAPIERVWDAVLDVERVAPAVPGAEVLERTGDDSYSVAIRLKVGPMSMKYQGEVEISERDEAAHRAVMKARARESRGQGTANADVTMVLSGQNGRTSATVTTDVQVTGRVASMGQGVLQDVSGRLVDTFAKNLATMLEGGPAPQAAATPSAPPPVAEPVRPETEPPRREAPPPPPEREDALDLGSIGGDVVAERLRDPRALGGLLGFVALVAFLLGRRSAR
jgi:carbon monoxide dehydrogenase subunit G